MEGGRQQGAVARRYRQQGAVARRQRQQAGEGGVGSCGATHSQRPPPHCRNSPPTHPRQKKKHPRSCRHTTAQYAPASVYSTFPPTAPVPPHLHTPTRLLVPCRRSLAEDRVPPQLWPHDRAVCTVEARNHDGVLRGTVLCDRRTRHHARAHPRQPAAADGVPGPRRLRGDGEVRVGEVWCGVVNIAHVYVALLP
eukprot:228009-Chlamydomonas_euryale.AAC.3